MSGELAPTPNGAGHGEAVEGELLRPGPRPLSFWERIKLRLFLAAVTGVIGAGLLVAGVLLTLSVLGAFVGVPLLLAGTGTLAAAAWILLGGSLRFGR